MTAVAHTLAELWQRRQRPERPYLLLCDARGYLTEVPPDVSSDGVTVPVRFCANEWALRAATEAERESGQGTPCILITPLVLLPDTVPDMQARASVHGEPLSGNDLAAVLGLPSRRPLFDRLPIGVFWNLSPYLSYLPQYGFERVLLASVLGDGSVLSAGWTPDQVLEKLWYDGGLARFREVLSRADPDDRRILEEQFLALVGHWLDAPRRALVEAAILEKKQPPVLPLCLLASILDGWGALEPAHLRRFIDGTELGDLFGDVLTDGANLTGLADWGRRIAFRADEGCAQALCYLESEVFPHRPEALTQALASVVHAVSGSGHDRLLGQLVRLLEADGALLAQGLAVTLRRLLDATDIPESGTLPLEECYVNLSARLDAPDSEQWQRLLDLLRRHQARERYEDHVALLEAMITLHRLTGQAEKEAQQLGSLGWQGWLSLVDRLYLPLAMQAGEADALTEKLPKRVDVFRLVNRARSVLKTIATHYARFYTDPAKGLPRWINERNFAAGTSRPWLNSDVVGHAVRPLLGDAGIAQVYLIVFDGMSATNWAMLRDRYLMVKGRELFRTHSALPAERLACTYLPSITHLCRRAIFAGETPRVFYNWPRGTSEPDLLTQCLDNNGCRPPGWDPNKHYFCYNEENTKPEHMRRDLRTLIDSTARLKAIVFNLQDRLLNKSGVSSLQEIMLTYVREVALPQLRRIAAQPRTAIVITADHGFAQYDSQYVVGDLTPNHQVHIHNRCLEYPGADRSSCGPSTAVRIDAEPFGLPMRWTGADVVTGPESYGWPPRGGRAPTTPQKVRGHDHGGLTPEETVVPVAIYLTRGA